MLADIVYDNGLSALADINAIHICSSEPADYAAIVAITLGIKVSPTVGAPAAGDPDGRQVTITGFSDGSVTATGTASHIAIVDTAGSVLLATKALTASQAVTSGNTFSLPTFDIRIPDAA